ncbi:hypothetical protein KIV56_03045 [Cryobacterium breve]|uniref:HAD family hydrolase n=1 Tax=Cryobacterium breve TaxID=1259258 RepID=A0ABY7NFZ1_9MICO|nr:hypothetical protein [Cryobacterium breve]WBM80468.1 hypothetical protein KIV56_03045 [Cryobacterium breve]
MLEEHEQCSAVTGLARSGVLDLAGILGSQQVGPGIGAAMERTGVLDVRLVLAAGDRVADVQAAVNSGAIAVGVLTGQLEREGFLGHTHDYILESGVETLGLAETQPA